MSELWRTFLAIPVGTAVQDCLQSMVEQLQTEAGRDRVRWTHPTGRHLTLHFLGDTQPSHIEEMTPAIQDALATVPAFALQLSDTGVFPHANQPRVLWVGMHADSTSLKTMHTNLGSILEKFDYKVDRRTFRPHITLGRVKYLSNHSNLVHSILSYDVANLSFQVCGMKWMRSTLTPEGARYSELKEFSLATEAEDGR